MRSVPKGERKLTVIFAESGRSAMRNSKFTESPTETYFRVSRFDVRYDGQKLVLSDDEGGDEGRGRGDKEIS